MEPRQHPPVYMSYIISRWLVIPSTVYLLCQHLFYYFVSGMIISLYMLKTDALFVVLVDGRNLLLTEFMALEPTDMEG